MVATQVRDWLKSRLPFSRRGQSGAWHRLTGRPQIENLEDRCLPATLTWNGFITNNWANSGNWTGAGRSPANGDRLIFPDGFELSETNNDIFDLTLDSITFLGHGRLGSDYRITGNAFRLDTMINAGVVAPGISVAVAPRIDCPILLGPGAAKTLLVGPSSALTLNGSINDAPGSHGVGFQKTGSGRLILTADNSYSGRTTVVAGEILSEISSAFGANGPGNDTVVNAGATLSVALPPGSKPTVETVTLNSESSKIQGALNGISGTWAGTINLATNDAAISVPAGSNFTISGKITGTGSLTKLGSGTLQLAGSVVNDYAGFTFVFAGTLELNAHVNRGLGAFGIVAVPHDLTIGSTTGFVVPRDTVRLLFSNQIAASSTVTVRKSGELDLNGLTVEVGSLTMVGGWIHSALFQTSHLFLNGNVTATKDNDGDVALIDRNINLDLGGASRTFTVNAGPTSRFNEDSDLDINSTVIGGAGQLVKQGTGKLRLLGGGTYTGTTTVSAGELAVEADFGSSPFTVAGGTLSGNGTIGPLTANGGVVEPEATLTVLTSVTLNSGSVFDSSVSHPTSGALAFNQLVVRRDTVNGPLVTVTLNGATLLNDLPVSSQPGDRWAIIHDTDPQGTTSGFLSVRGQPIDGGTDPIVQFSPFQYTPDGVKIFTLTYGQDVTLQDTPTTVGNLAVTPNIIDEGQQVALTGIAIGSQPNDPLSLTILWGDGSNPEVHNLNQDAFPFTHTYADNPPGVPREGAFTITVSWSDVLGFSNHQTLSVIVNNVVPTVFAGDDVTLSTGDTLTRSGIFVDPDTDTWTATVDYGDGTGAQPLNLNPDMTFDLAYTYTAAGTYQVVVAVQDSDGETGTGSFVVNVVDPAPAPGGRHAGPPSAAAALDGEILALWVRTAEPLRPAHVGISVASAKGQPIDSTVARSSHAGVVEMLFRQLGHDETASRLHAGSAGSASWLSHGFAEDFSLSLAAPVL